MLTLLTSVIRWLAKKGRDDKARSVLAHVRRSTQELVEEEFKEIVASTHNDSTRGLLDALKLLLKWRVFHR